MADIDKQIHRERFIGQFRSLGFERTKKAEKADQYEHKESQTTLYFYWAQGSNSLDLAIDPRHPYEKFLTISGVSLKKTRRPDGIRFGTAMTHFPFEYETYRPEDSQSRVGRMFSVSDSALALFTKGLVNQWDAAIEQDVSRGEAISQFDVPHIESGERGSNSPPGAAVDSLSETLDEFKSIIDSISNASGGLKGEDVDAVVKRRVGQGVFRSFLERIYGPVCHVCGINLRGLLVASHIVPWSKSAGHERTDPDNGLLLAVNWDAAFDKGLISFDEFGAVIFSEMLDESLAKIIGIDKAGRLPEKLLTPKRKAYLARHRGEIFERWKNI